MGAEEEEECQAEDLPGTPEEPYTGPPAGQATVSAPSLAGKGESETPVPAML